MGACGHFRRRWKIATQMYCVNVRGGVRIFGVGAASPTPDLTKLASSIRPNIFGILAFFKSQYHSADVNKPLDLPKSKREELDAIPKNIRDKQPGVRTLKDQQNVRYASNLASRLRSPVGYQSSSKVFASHGFQGHKAELPVSSHLDTLPLEKKAEMLLDNIAVTNNEKQCILECLNRGKAEASITEETFDYSPLSGEIGTGQFTDYNFQLSAERQHQEYEDWIFLCFDSYFYLGSVL
ncbi:hypothetical protein EDB80DRAFT_685759 [Ilyonectria destructans]|nr:hypothetical protein EDB80DRAFT_685759 [Ilyonectria destructans]